MIGFRGDLSKTYIEMTLSSNKVTNKKIKKATQGKRNSIINDKKTYLDQLSTRSNKISMYLKSSSNGLCFLVIKASFYPFLMHLNLIILTKINLEHNTHRTIFLPKKISYLKKI